MKFLFFTVAYMVSGAAFAQSAWICEDASGHRYQSSQSVMSDSCTPVAQGTDPESVQPPSRKNPKWGVEAFCRDRKSGECETSKDGLERGSLNGVWFRLFADSAVVAGAKDYMPDGWSDKTNWSVNCSRDKMTSTRSCLIYRSDLYIFVKSGGGVSVSVGSDHFPQSQSSIKIGSRRFDTSQRDGVFANGSQLVSQMRNGTVVVTRYMKWPYRTWIDDEFTVYGASTAVQVAKWIIAKGEM